MKIIYKILILLILFLIMNSCVTSQILLKKRIEKYFSGINPKTMWELSSEKLKRENDNNEEEFIKYFEENNYFKEYKNIHFSIEKINVKGNKAKVKMKFSGEEIVSGRKVEENFYDYWIFEKDNWYLGDTRTE